MSANNYVNCDDDLATCTMFEDASNWREELRDIQWRVQGGAPGARAPPSPWPWHCVMINLMARRLFLA